MTARTYAPFRCPPYPGVAERCELWCPCCHGPVPAELGVHECVCGARVRVLGADVRWTEDVKGKRSC